MKFNYEARTVSGEIQKGTINASSKGAAISLLQSYGLYITSLRQERDSIFGLKLELFQRIGNKDIVVFFRQLAILFKSNVPVVESLKAVSAQTSNRNLKDKIIIITEKIEGGTPLSQTLKSFPKIFSAFSIGVIKSGEATGRLPDVLGYLADHTEKEYNFRMKIISAMAYPVFVIVVFIAILILMSILVIPQLTEILLEAGGELPYTTILVINSAKFLQNYWWLLLIIIFVIIFFIHKIRQTEEGKEFFDRLFLNTPFLNTFLKKIYLTRTAENLSTLISAGFPIVPALEVTSDIVGNTVYKEVIMKAGDGVKKGETISTFFSRYPNLFSPLFIQMLIVGEKTGKMDETLINIVNYYEGEVERALENFVKMLEPIMIIVLGFFVAFLMASILLPLYTISLG